MNNHPRFFDDGVIKVLLVEDNLDEADLVKNSLENGTTLVFDLTTLDNIPESVEAIGAQDFDVILLGLTLPESDMLDTFNQIFGHSKGIPIIVLSEDTDETPALEIVRAGAQDHLIKGDANYAALARSIRFTLERERGKINLRRSEDRFRSLIENAIDLITLVDSNSTISYASPSYLLQLGHNPQNLLGKPFFDLLHENDMDKVLTLIKDCTKNKDSSSFAEFRLLHANGRWVIYEGFFTYFEDTNTKNNNIEIKVSINARDIDERVLNHQEMQAAYDETLEGWSRALELRDKATDGHSKRLAEVTFTLAQAMDIEGEDLVNIYRGTLLHDIGKMAIPDNILHKDGDLTEEEWEIMHKHPVYAYEMLYQIEYLRPALDIPYCHHEKWDGSGYPRGLRGTEIPLAARIFTVADVWDALISERPYSDPWPIEKARQYLIDEAHKHFDPKVVSIFLELFT